MIELPAYQFPIQYGDKPQNFSRSPVHLPGPGRSLPILESTQHADIYTIPLGGPKESLAKRYPTYALGGGAIRLWLDRPFKVNMPPSEKTAEQQTQPINSMLLYPGRDDTWLGEVNTAHPLTPVDMELFSRVVDLLAFFSNLAKD